jgi:DNA-binding MarR family transcriptional regulator
MRFIQHAYLFQILETRNLPPAEKVLLIYLASYAGKDGKCWPSVETLARDCEVSTRTVRRNLNKLAERELLSSEATHADGRQASNLYTLHLQEVLLPSIRRPDHGDGVTACRGDNTSAPPDKNDTGGVTNCQPKEVKEKITQGGGGFCLDGTGNKPPTKEALRLARQLYKTIKALGLTTVKKPNKGAWARPVDKLMETDHQDPATILRVLQWYAENGTGRYTPKVRDAIEFRRKFPALLQAIERTTGEDATEEELVITEDAQRVLKDLRMAIWPPDLDANLPTLVQRSLTNSQAIAAMAVTALRTLPEDDRVHRFIMAKRATLFSSSLDRTLQWFRSKHLRGVDHIQAADLVLSIDHPDYQKHGARESMEYSGKTTLWTKTMEAFREGQ